MIDVPVGGIGEVPFASMGDLGLDKAKVIQCALSRICGVCGESLDRPVAFLGSRVESDANGFHFPPTHEDCAQIALDRWAEGWHVALGQSAPPAEWMLVTTGGFEFVRMSRDDEDRRPVFAPNSRIAERTVAPDPRA